MSIVSKFKVISLAPKIWYSQSKSKMSLLLNYATFYKAAASADF